MAEAREGTADVERDIALTRERMSRTLAELDDVVESKVQAVKDKLDVGAKVGDFVREHPWIALGAALGAGAAVALSGTDARVARASVDLSKKGASAAKDGAVAAPGAIAGAVTSLTHALIDRVRGRTGYEDTSAVANARAAREALEAGHATVDPSFTARMQENAAIFVEDLREESRTLGRE